MFEIGREYKRREEIHGVIGGQEQGGISTPKEHPYVMIFTSAAGEQHGYHDRYENGLFMYTGEGQQGDMGMIRGNLAIKDHKLNERTILLFEQTRKAFVRFVGEADCVGYHNEIRPNSEGSPRNAFIFHLDINPNVQNDKGLDEEVEVLEKKSLKKKSLSELREIALQARPKSAKAEVKLVVSKNRSLAIKGYCLKRAAGGCEHCGEPAPFLTKAGPYLEVHHITRLADDGPDEPQNVIALCPNCHREAHYSTERETIRYKMLSKAQALEGYGK
ncbi:MAG: HNH endonuclease signature motif containing protein [Cycloclasticus sp.]|jgi:HNH endonuclease.